MTASVKASAVPFRIAGRACHHAPVPADGPDPSLFHERGGLSRIATLPLILIARLWQLGPSRLIPSSCRYSPSCSAYAIEAWRRHGVVRGTMLAAGRLLRCHPWGGCGHDPVPPARLHAADTASALSPPAPVSPVKDPSARV